MTDAAAPKLKDLIGSVSPPWEEIGSILRSRPTEYLSAECQASQNDYHGQSLLHNVLMGNYQSPAPPDVVRGLIEAYPPAVSHQDSTGQSAIYYACYYRSSPETLRALLKPFRDAANSPLSEPISYWSHPARRGAEHGSLPLHVAFEPHAALELLDVYPEGVSVRDKEGEIPLHSVVSWGEAGAARILVRAGIEQNVGGVIGAGGALVRDKYGKTPLDRACEHVVTFSTRAGAPAVPMDPRKAFVFVRGPVSGHAPLCDLEGEEVRGIWDKCLAMLEACHWSEAKCAGKHADCVTAAGAGLSTLPPFRALHTAVTMRCPPEIVWHAAARNLDLVCARDERGRTPLHLVAVAAGERKRRDPRGRTGHHHLRPRGTFEDDSDDDEVADYNEHIDEIADMLLHSSSFGSTQPARMADRDGRLPLHLAALCGTGFKLNNLPFGPQGGCLEKILRADPSALETRDSQGMYPFMLAAVSVGDIVSSLVGKSGVSKRGEIDTIYGLLREAPTVIEMCV